MGFRFLPYKKAKKGVQIAGVDYDDSGGGGGSYTLPPATASTLGGIKVGSNLSVESDGTLSGSAPYTLPTASSEVLGGVKVGSGLSINDGVLSTTGGGNEFVVERHHPSTSLTLNALTGEFSTIDVSKNGYTPIGLVGAGCGNGNVALWLFGLNFNDGDTDTAYIALRNLTNSAITLSGSEIYAVVLYCKN